MTGTQQRGRRTLLLIAGVFVLPILLAIYMYFSGNNWGATATTQNGELITPPRNLPDLTLTPEPDSRQLYGIWNLVVLAGEQCDAGCVNALEQIRQIRLALGPKMTRAQTIFLPTTIGAIAPELNKSHPALIVVPPDESQQIRNIIGEYRNGQIFIVDPLGNLMMQYAPGASMGDIREDLGHLLKLSGIG